MTAPSSRTGATDREVLVRAAARFQLDPESASAEVSSADVSVAGQLAMWVRARDKHGSNKQETAYGLAYLLAARAAAAPLARVQQVEAWDAGYSAAQLDADEQPYSDMPEAATWKPRRNPHLAALLAEQPGGGR